MFKQHKIAFDRIVAHDPDPVDLIMITIKELRRSNIMLTLPEFLDFYELVLDAQPEKPPAIRLIHSHAIPEAQPGKPPALRLVYSRV